METDRILSDGEVAGAFPTVLFRYSQGKTTQTATAVPLESPLTIYVNGTELVTLLCTPVKLNCLVLGFLYSEGLISGLEDILLLRVCDEEPVAEVKLKREWQPPQRRITTSGCGGGVSFSESIKDIPAVDSSLNVKPEVLLGLMHQLSREAHLFRTSGGVHSSALSDGETILAMAEDIGRHNTVDKVLGECLLRRIPIRGRLLLTTGRLSSEMVLKAARAGIPLLASRNSPTSLAMALARELGITLAGYVRGGRLSIYTYPERVA